MDSENKVIVPKIIYETFENVLEGQIRKLALQIADSLKVDEKVLLKELKKDKLSVLFLEESDTDDIDLYTCKAFDKFQNIYIPCDEPVVYKKEFCFKHMTNHVTKKDIQNNEVLYVLKYENMKYYIDKNNKVYDSSFNKIGYYDTSDESIVEFVHSDTT